MFLLFLDVVATEAFLLLLYFLLFCPDIVRAFGPSNAGFVAAGTELRRLRKLAGRRPAMLLDAFSKHARDGGGNDIEMVQIDD